MADFYGNDQGTYEQPATFNDPQDYGYTTPPATFNDPQDYDYGAAIDEFMGNYGGAESAESSIVTGSTATPGVSGVAKSLGDAWSWFNDPKNDKKSSTLMALFGGALAGIGKQKTSDRQSKAQMMSAEASQMNAQTAATIAERKNANANAKVNFGLMSKPVFSDKLAVRRARSGA